MSNNGNTVSTHPLTRALGWFALGLGAAELVAPKRLANLIGLRPSNWTTGILRVCGAREALTGIGILSGAGSRRWLQTRIVGDIMDAGLLWRALGRSPWHSFLTRSHQRPRLTGALLAVGGVAALDVVALGLGSWNSRREKQQGSRSAITASITIDRTAADLYKFWRQVENLPRFLSYVESVTTRDRVRSHWRVKVPHGPSLEWDATIVEDRPEQRIVWTMQSSKLGMLIDSGEVRFEPAPGGRGTEVHLTLWGRAVPKVMARWLRKLPERFWSAQLHRLKQLLELGEITVSDASPFFGPHPARPAQEELTSAPLASSATPTPGPAVADTDDGRPS